MMWGVASYRSRPSLIFVDGHLTPGYGRSNLTCPFVFYRARRKCRIAATCSPEYPTTYVVTEFARLDFNGAYLGLDGARLLQEM